MCRFSFLFLFVLVFPVLSCGGRMPSPKTAHHMTNNFFKKYGNNYKTSLFGTQSMEQIEINGIRQQSRQHAEIDAFIRFTSGQLARVLITAKNTPPVGWSVLSWELLGVQ